jgi:hypothetical protein
MKPAMKNATPSDSTSNSTSNNTTATGNQADPQPIKQSLNGMVSILPFLTKALHDAQTNGYDRDQIAGLWHLLHGVKEAAENCYELYCQEQHDSQ